MKYLCILIISFCLLISCSDNSDSIVNQIGGVSFYRIEQDPSLSYDRSFLLMIRSDTIYRDYNGIYSANVVRPIRNLICLGEEYSSPTFNDQYRASLFLKDSLIYIHDAIIDSVYSSNLPQKFGRIRFINSELLIGESDSHLYTIDLINLQSLQIGSGFLQSALNVDSLIFLREIGNHAYEIDLLPASEKSFLEVTPLDTIYSERPQSFGIEPILKHYCFTEFNGVTYDIIAGGVAIDSTWKVAESIYSGIIMLDYNTILYTGPDGRLYTTDFLGANTFPFWAALDS